MKEILSILAIPLSGAISYALGYLAHRRQINAKATETELGNYQRVIDLYKGTFDDLKKEIESLRRDIIGLRKENAEIKKENHQLKLELQELNGKL